MFQYEGKPVKKWSDSRRVFASTWQNPYALASSGAATNNSVPRSGNRSKRNSNATGRIT